MATWLNVDQEGGMELIAPQQASGRRKHLWTPVTRPALAARKPTTAFDKALQVACCDAPVNHWCAKVLLGGRVSPHTVRSWRLGHRAVPPWVVDVLQSLLRQRVATDQEAIDILEKEKGR